ncbi:MAG: hypothetical protein AAGA85_27365, partial [Bacteroidota bacterium]
LKPFNSSTAEGEVLTVAWLSRATNMCIAFGCGLMGLLTGQNAQHHSDHSAGAERLNGDPLRIST